MKTHPAFANPARLLPEPKRALRLARLLIPLSLFVGGAAEPVLRWLLPI